MATIAKAMAYSTLIDTGLRRETLSKIVLLDSLTDEFMDEVKMVHVFASGTIAILVTNNEMVYGIKSEDRSGFDDSLGLGTTQNLQLLQQLCGRGVKQIVTGFRPRDSPSPGLNEQRHVLVLTESGDVYAWGDNDHGQLGNGTTISSKIPLKCDLQNKKMKQICAGMLHSMALSENNEVLCWGRNRLGQCGNGTTENVHTPTNVFEMTDKYVKMIASGPATCAALTLEGDMYVWGSGEFGQLGIGNVEKQLSPQKIKSFPSKVIDIACGSHSSLAVTDNNELYVWGHGIMAGAGNGDSTEHQLEPVKIMDDVKEIAAVNNSTAALAVVTCKGDLYYWGFTLKWNDSVVVELMAKPTKTSLIVSSTLHGLFLDYFALTYKPIQFQRSIEDALPFSTCIANAFNEIEDSDIRFKIEGKTIHLHKVILRSRSQHFAVMFRSEWKEMSTNEVEISHYSYDVYKAFLEYLYTDKVDVAVDVATDLIELADCYQENRLKLICADIVKKTVNVENAAILFAMAVKYRCKDLEKVCLGFCVENFREVAISDALGEIEGSVMTELMRKVDEAGGLIKVDEAGGLIKEQK